MKSELWELDAINMHDDADEDDCVARATITSENRLPYRR